MSIDIKALREKKAAGTLKGGSVGGGGNGIKVPAGEYICKVLEAKVAPGFKNPASKNLAVKLEIVEATKIDAEGISGEDLKSKWITWYFPGSVKDAGHSERLVADLDGLMEAMGVSSVGLYAEDNETILDIYTSFCADITKPLGKGTVSLVKVARWPQKSGDNFNHGVVADDEAPAVVPEVKSAPKAAKATAKAEPVVVADAEDEETPF